MSGYKLIPLGTLLLSACLPALAAAHIHRGPTAHRAGQNKVHTAKKIMGPRVMASARATEIQSALIRNGYLSGSPSGVWDGPSEEAMQKYQAANGWQTKLTPDSRAIIKLGLGPSPSAHAGAPATLSSPTAVTPVTPAMEPSLAAVHSQ